MEGIDEAGGGVLDCSRKAEGGTGARLAERRELRGDVGGERGGDLVLSGVTGAETER